jgi:hypothetical protein
MKYLKSYKLYESAYDDVDYFKSMLSDLEDDGYRIEVDSQSNPNDWKEDCIRITIEKDGFDEDGAFTDPIIISDITNKIKQVLDIVTNYSIWNIIIDYHHFSSGGSEDRLEYKSLDDIKVKDMLRLNGLYSVLEYGMDEWINEMTLYRIVGPNELFSGPGYKYHFISSSEVPGGEPEELKIEIGEKDIEEDVRPGIKWIRIYLDRK